MKTNYLLVDYENVQPKSLQLLNGHHPVRVLVFVGANQTKVPTGFAASMQALGSAGEYVQLCGSGRNALDFHIAYTLGRLATTDPDGCFHVISKDTGFDPLLMHLRSLGIRAHRSREIADIPFLKIANAGTVAEQVDAIVGNLRSRGNSRPRKLKTLSSTIHALFQKSLEPSQVEDLIRALQDGGHIRLDGDAVTYDLPRG